MSENKSEDLKDLPGELQEQLERLALAQEVMVPGAASGEVLKTEIGKESVTTVTARSGENKNKDFTKPDYSKPTIISGSFVQISSPIVLIEGDRAWPELKVDTDGILLEKGFYKIEYTLNNVKPGHGLGLFNTRREFQKLLMYHRYLGDPPTILFKNGHFYLEIKETSVIALTDDVGKYRPKNDNGIIFVTVHQYKTCECTHTLGW